MSETTGESRRPGWPAGGLDAAGAYLVDAAQRTILYWDILRQRGNQFFASMARQAPNVLNFDYELVLDGRTLPEPVNYGLVRIVPPAGMTVDDRKRPFVVVDPRAGHGPGIGGFKAESEVGVIMAEGHPCYFIGFLPQPEPGQTIDKVIRAQARFLELVGERHPDTDEKPVIIGNCQAGWAVMMLAAAYPHLCGPIIAAGAPLSYWAGVRGENPMRYTGGLLGGSWLTALVSDLGNGKFDGSWLVQNFESLNPANTLWTKQYNLYARVDTEAPRYLEFERWWDAHVLLNGEEIQYIVDNLFIGNKLSTARIVTDDRRRIDLRNIKSPIICFCSRGDNITPPQQALGWIPDLYDSVDDIRASGQTIIYAIHDHIGHLGIFVSTGVAVKEHREFASNIDLIDCLPPGLYEAVIEKATPATANRELVRGDYITRFASRTLDDLRALGGNTLDEERCFAAVDRFSATNYGLYRTTSRPLVRVLANETTAEWQRRLHPLRLSYEIFSDRNPCLQILPALADWVRQHRRPAAADNPWLLGQELCSAWIKFSLDAYRDWRDLWLEQLFFGFYGQPWFQALVGLKADDGPPRQHPGLDPAHLTLVENKKATLREKMDQGGPREACLRSLLYVNLLAGEADERKFEMLRRLRAAHADSLSLAGFKAVLREQFCMLLLDEKRALATLPALLAGVERAKREEFFSLVERVATAGDPLDAAARRRLATVKKLFLGKEVPAAATA
ncbi:MAG: DUF3141 domain-containing protein [Deltaproteobacteria bacterium]|nr:DUF3141 domain-containing protein [Deltaproteobacteria bacterium]